MKVDFRSDTLTQPTPAMLDAMFSAPVGDDVYGEDPSINQLQEKLSALFGMDRALFCPSGTMCNQIAIRIGTLPQSEVICAQLAHVYLYEAGGIAANSLSSVRTIAGDRGRLKAADIEANINPDNIHFAKTSMVCLENTVNKGGGCCYELADIKEIRALCDQYGLHLHLDGARLFNAIVAKDYTPKEIGTYFDTISICLSKGLGAPVGSVLLMREEMSRKAQFVRKQMGGSMRQAGYLAAAGIYALDHHVDRLTEDHYNAKLIEQALNAFPLIEEVLTVETNIIIFKPKLSLFPQQRLIQALKELDILVAPFGPEYIRIVTHLDLTTEMIQYSIESLERLCANETTLVQ